MGKIDINFLEEFFKTATLTEEKIKLESGAYILDQKLFTESHLDILKANSGRKVMLPYFLRLVKFYKIIKQQK